MGLYCIVGYFCLLTIHLVRMMCFFYIAHLKWQLTSVAVLNDDRIKNGPGEQQQTLL